MHKNRMKLYLSIAVISEEKYWYILRWDGHDGTFGPYQMKKAGGNNAFKGTLEKSGNNGNPRMTTSPISLHPWQGIMIEDQKAAGAPKL